MRRVRSFSPTLLVAVPALAILAGLVVSYLLYVQSRERYFTERNLRALSVLSRQIESLTQRLRSSLENAGKAARDAGAEKLIGPAHWAAPLANQLKIVPHLELHPFMDPLPCRLSDRPNDTGVTLCATDEPLIIQEPRNGDRAVAERIRPRARITARKVYWCDQRKTDVPGDYCVSIDVAAALRPLIENTPLDGLDVFLADETGRVLFERGASALHLLALPQRPEREVADSKDPTPTPTRSGLQLPFIEDLQQATSISSMTFDGSAYKLYGQPIHISATAERNGAQAPRARVWVVGAIVSSAGFAAEARTVSFATMAIVPLLLLLLLLVPPILKVWTVGPRDRFTQRDVLALNICVTFAAGLATIMLLDWNAYRALTVSADEEMRGAAERLETNFRDEMGWIQRSLQNFADQRVPVAQRINGQPIANRVVCTSVLRDGSSKCSGGVGDQRLLELFRVYPYFDMLILSAADGWQREKWATATVATPLIKGGARSDPFPNVVTSQNTAETLVAHSQSIERPSGEPLGSATVVPHLMSLVDPVLPSGFEFAVIESDGRILFHSNARRRLYENFFAEVGNGGPLGATIFAARSGWLDLVYHGRPSRAYVQPLEDYPWTLIVLRDKELQRTANLEVLVTAVLLFALYVGAYVLALILVQLWHADRLSWLWPDPARTALYRRCAAALAAIGVWFAWAIRSYEPLATLTLLVLMPVAALSLIVAAFRRPGEPHRLASVVLLVIGGGVAWMSLKYARHSGTRADILGLVLLLPTVTLVWRALTEPTRARDRSRLAFAYVGLGLALLTVTAVLPAVALYTDAFEHGMETLARFRSYALADALAARAARIESRYKEIGGKRLVDERLSETWDTPDREGRFRVGAWVRNGRGNPGLCRATDHRLAWEWFSPAAARLLNVAFPAACTQPAAAGEKANGQRRNSSGPEDLCSVIGRHYTALLPAFFPVYNDESMRLRQLVYDRAAHCRWQWDGNGGGLGRLEFSPVDSTSTNGERQTLQVNTQPLKFPLPERDVHLLFASIAVGVFILGAYFLARDLAKRIYGLDVEFEPVPPPAQPAPASGWFLLRPDRQLVGSLRQVAHTIDLLEVDSTPDWKEWLEELDSTAPGVLLDHFEHRIDEAAWNQQKLALLEELVLRKHRTVIVVSQLDPLGYFARRIRSPGDKANETNYVTQDEMTRWALVLARLRKVSSTPLPADERLSLEQADAVLQSECAWSERLLSVKRQIREAMGTRPPWRTRKDLVAHVGDLAEAHYRVLWSRCTDEERLVLIHLARYGFVNPKNWEIVRRLARRRLIKRTPAVRIMNESFRSFVRTVEGSAQIRELERAAGQSDWAKLRNALGAIVVLVGIFLFVTQPDVLAKWIGFVTAIAGGTGALMQLLGLFQGGRAAATTQQ
jgi:hypothetical protein